MRDGRREGRREGKIRVSRLFLSKFKGKRVTLLQQFIAAATRQEKPRL